MIKFEEVLNEFENNIKKSFLDRKQNTKNELEILINSTNKYFEEQGYENLKVISENGELKLVLEVEIED